MTDSLQHELATRITPSPGLPEWYFFILIAAILVGMLAWKWLDLQKAKMQQSECPDAALRDVVLQMKAEIMTRMQHLEDKLDNDIEREEARLDAIERKMEDGFRSVHKRMDDHIDNHGRRI